MKKIIFIALISTICLILCPEASAQDRGEGFGEVAVCVYPVAGMRLQAGKNAQYLEPIKYGQEVTLLGDTAYVPSEARVYMRVKSKSGKVGWVHRHLFELHANQVVVTRTSQIYGSPGAVTTITTAKFEAGELAAMADFQEDWILLVGAKKEKKGWIKRSGGVEPISVSNTDIAIAALMEAALENPDITGQITSLEAIQQQPGFSNSPMKTVVVSKIESLVMEANQQVAAESSSQQVNEPLPANQSSNSRNMASTSVMAASSQRLASTSVSTSTNPNRLEETVYDSNTGQNYVKITEKGTVYVVKGPENARSIYFAYHKDLPKGAKILVNIPDNSGFVELEVINKLGANRPQIIALSQECLEAIYGEGVKDPLVEIVYFIKQQ